MEKVFEFLYNSDCCESSAATMSIHKTRKGAEMAMEFHKKEIRDRFEYEEKYFKEHLEDYKGSKYPWDYDQWWGLRETELKD